jgi:hypothetical protein
VNDREIDEMLAAGAEHEVDAALLGRIATSMTASLRPVKPIASAPVLAAWLLSISIIVAVACAWWLGFYGIRKLDVAEIGSIFPALAIFTWLAALLCVAEMTPGGLRWKNPGIMEPVMTNPGMLLLVVIGIWIALDALVFRDYDMGAFIPQGVGCLRAGLAIAIPAGAGGWLLLRRGFAVNPGAAGLAAGMVAGLAGLLMLEMHCPNLRAPHVMVWHTAVVPVSALSGGILARIATRR